MGKMDWSSDRPGKGNVSDTVRNFRRRRGLFEVHRIIYSDVLPPAVVATRSRPTWWLATRRDGAKLRAVSSAIAVNPLIVERSRLGQRELLLPFFFRFECGTCCSNILSTLLSVGEESLFRERNRKREEVAC